MSGRYLAAQAIRSFYNKMMR